MCWLAEDQLYVSMLGLGVGPNSLEDHTSVEGSNHLTCPALINEKVALDAYLARSAGS